MLYKDSTKNFDFIKIMNNTLSKLGAGGHPTGWLVGEKAMRALSSISFQLSFNNIYLYKALDC